LGIRYTYDISNDAQVYAMSGYATAMRSWWHGAGAEWKWGFTKRRRGGQKRGFTKADFYWGADTRYVSDTYSPWITSSQPLFGGADYFDYYRSHRVRLSTGYNLRNPNVTWSLAFTNDVQSHLEKRTDYVLLGHDKIQRINPAIPEGTMRSVEVALLYGEPYVPFGFIGQNRVELKIEHSAKGLSDFDFTTYRAAVDWRIPTFFTRRFLPNAIDVHAVAGTYSGKLPIQRFAILDASLRPFTPFAAFKTLRGAPYEGEKYGAVFWEYNFRTVPFELLGLRSIASKGISLIVHGASGRTWLTRARLASLGYTPSYTDRFHHEIGLSLSGLFDFFRIDTAERLDRKGFYAGLSFARVF
jgi:hypothetical protein